jgi:hypothetical protein
MTLSKKKIVRSPICSAVCRETRHNFTLKFWGSVRKVELDPESSQLYQKFSSEPDL